MVRIRVLLSGHATLSLSLRDTFGASGAPGRRGRLKWIGESEAGARGSVCVCTERDGGDARRGKSGVGREIGAWGANPVGATELNTFPKTDS